MHSTIETLKKNNDEVFVFLKIYQNVFSYIYLIICFKKNKSSHKFDEKISGYENLVQDLTSVQKEKDLEIKELKLNIETLIRNKDEVYSYFVYINLLYILNYIFYRKS